MMATSYVTRQVSDTKDDKIEQSETNGKHKSSCDLRMMGTMSSDTSSDEEYEEHSVENFSLEAVEHGWSGGLVYSFLKIGSLRG